MAEFVTPDFLQNCGTDDNHKKMIDIMPPDIDISEGSHGWNMTRPTALVMAEMCEYYLVEAIRLILPEWSYGTFLEGHAKGRNIFRRAATAASGKITITGEAGTVIPTGSLFSMPSVNDDPSVDYETTEAATIQPNGSVTVPVQCTQTGIVGNAPANTIVLVSNNISRITSVTNQEAITGGTEQESDESLITRILERDQSQDNSFVGNPSDYKRWANEVAGVGEVTVIPAQDDTGLVQIILSDANGTPATESLCEEVYKHIMAPDNPDARLAPIGAYLSVNPPTVVAICVKATVELKDGVAIESVKAAYASKLAEYLQEAFADREIKYTRVANALGSTAGVNDYASLQMGIKSGDTVEYGTANINIDATQLPTITEDNLVLTAGTV